MILWQTMAAVAVLGALVGQIPVNAESPPRWQDALSLAGGGTWSDRLPITLTNLSNTALQGWYFDLVVETTGPSSALIGTPARAVRVCDAAGVELRTSLRAPAGRQLEDEPVTAGCHVGFGVACEAGSSARYHVYFGNPLAWQPPDSLPGHSWLINGDFELGTGSAPAGWTHDPPTAHHQASWSSGEAHSGTRALKTVVADQGEPTWIATRQRQIQVLPGARYRFEAWVKAERVAGYAGWYLHVGNDRDPMALAPLLRAGDGTFDWQPVAVEFRAPADASRLDMGTVLRGTGTAWFDSARLDLLDPTPLQIDLAPAEHQPQPASAPTAKRAWLPDARRRALVRVPNFPKETAGPVLVAVDLAPAIARLTGQFRESQVLVLQGHEPVSHTMVANTLVFEAAAGLARDYVVYFDWTSGPPASPLRSSRLRSQVLQRANLVGNGSFEEGDELPTDWLPSGESTADGCTLAAVRPGKPGAGARCVRLHVPARAAAAWRGWRQPVAVRPGQTYLLAAWTRCSGVDDGEVRIHAHRRTDTGQLAQVDPFTSTSRAISGTTDWTQFADLFTMPADTTSFEIHLTMQSHGTVWHDDVLLTEVVPAQIVRLECVPAPADELACWTVPAVIKVLPDAPPAAPSAPAEISVAGNEWESLQLAFRSGRDLGTVQLTVVPPRDSAGRLLQDVHVNVVGTVPIDHASGYFRSDQPEWQRMSPQTPGQCDGWPGHWPDPLLPTNRWTMRANETRAVWVTLRVPASTSPGVYTGRVELSSHEGVLAQLPFQVRVRNFTLPRHSRLAGIYDVRLGPGQRWWGEDVTTLYPEIVRFLAERRLCPDTIQPDPVIRYEAGNVDTDFSRYDEAAIEYFDKLKLPHAYTPWMFYLFGWGHPPKVFAGEHPYEGEPPYSQADRSRLRPEYKRAYQACLKAYWDHVKERGWDDRIVLYISDEPYDQHEHIRVQMRALCDMIHEVDATIPIYSSTWKHVPAWDGALNVWGVGHYGRVPVNQMDKLRTEGARLWFTTDGQMCTDTPYCAIERLLPHYCFRYHVEAYEFWGVAWLTHDPYRYGWHAYIDQSGEPGERSWVRYPNGDGYLVYPGKPFGQRQPVSSIRLEQAREGLEDFEYLTLLQNRITTARQRQQDVRAAERVLEQAQQLVSIPNAGGRYSSLILPDPHRLYQLRADVAEAIEQLAD